MIPLESITTFAPYAPVAIFIASFLDVFFVTGLMLYGAATLGSVLMLYTSGMVTLEGIVIAGYSGTLLGNTLNYSIGRFFGKRRVVAQRLQQPRIEKARGFLQTRGLFLFMFVGRFVTFTRPLYALLLGSLRIRFSRFLLYESIIALFWIVFWLYILVQGEAIYQRFI